ncbi:AAA domain protein [compost metagenome]
MLLKINRDKNLGVFSDYAWDAGLPAFERFNVVFGENGSGKTTLSRLFDCLKTGGHDEYPALEFKIESETGDLGHGAAAARKIRVFNADYVQLNIGHLDGYLKPILVIGEENKAAADALAADELELAIDRRAMTTHQPRNIAERDFELFKFEKTATFTQSDLRIAIRYPISSMANHMNSLACCSLK